MLARFPKLFKRQLPIIIILLTTFLATFALFHSGLPPTHDGEYHVIRFYEFYKSLLMGQWYPRWAPDLYFGHGVPLFTYVYPLPNYIAALGHFFGISFIDGFKLNLILSSFVGATFMYFFAKEWWGRVGGIISAVFYTFSPYHFVDIYIRGSVGEVWALALFPAFLWAVTRYFSGKNILYATLAGLFLALIIFSHNILALMFVPFAITYCLLLLVRSKNKYSMLLALSSILLLGLSLSAIFWLPALLETKYVVGLQTFDYTRNFPELFQLLFPSWGSGFFGGGLGNEMAVQIGLANLFAVLGSLLVLKRVWNKNSKTRNMLLLFLISFFVVCFLLLRYSLPIWQHVPLMLYFQFPWRFLSLIILFSAFLAGSMVHIGKPKLVAGIVIGFCIVTTLSYAHPAYFMERSDSYYTSRSNFIDGTNSVGNIFNTIWARGIPKKSTQQLRFTAVTEKPTTIHLSLLYFPNWHVFVSGKEVAISPDTKGDIQFVLPKGHHAISVLLKQTALETIATVVTLVSIVILGVYLLGRFTFA